MADNMSEDLKAGALVYHRLPKPGKLEIQATKPLGNQRDLALAYSPGVAAARRALHDDPQGAPPRTARIPPCHARRRRYWHPFPAFRSAVEGRSIAYLR